MTVNLHKGRTPQKAEQNCVCDVSFFKEWKGEFDDQYRGNFLLGPKSNESKKAWPSSNLFSLYAGRYQVPYTVKKASGFAFTNRDFTDQTLPGRE
jgi:hypothetical protein